jgi:hypothetical protein
MRREYAQIRTIDILRTCILKKLMNKAFSWENQKEIAIQTKIRRAMTNALTGNNDDFNIKHKDWVRDAQSNNWTVMKKKIREDMEKKQLKYQQYNETLHARKHRI